MSFMQFQQQCDDCKEIWNAAFGIVGTSIIAEPPKHCPKCDSRNISKIADGWKITPVLDMGKQHQTRLSLFIAQSVPVLKQNSKNSDVLIRN
jgi:hypothetical protein